MQKLEQLKEQILKEKLNSGNNKTHFSDELRAKTVLLKKELNLGYQEMGRFLGISPKTIQNWMVRTEVKKKVFKKIPVAKVVPAVLTLELSNGAKVKGLSLTDLIQVIKSEAS